MKESLHSYGRSGYEKKISAHWVPRLLTVDQKHTRQSMSHSNLNLFLDRSISAEVCDY